jgi:cytochrome P450
VNREMRRKLPPGPRAPSVLQLVGTWTRPTASLERLRRYGKRTTVQLPFQPPFVILSDPAEVKELFAAAPEEVHPGEGARILEPVVGPNSVILLDESAHLSQRRLLLPAFHGERMQRLRGVMTELAESEVGSWPAGEPVALHPRLQRLTLEIILRAVFGLEQGPELERLRDVLSQVLTFGESPLSVLPGVARVLSWIPSQRRFNACLREADERIMRLIDDRRHRMAEGEPVADDVLSMLLGARHEPEEPDGEGTPMSDRELRDELMTALVAGHETTASQLGWALERLSREPRVQARAVEEIDAGQEERYLTAVVQEILRLRPVLPNAEPRLTKCEVQIGGYRYPRGVVLLASAALIHHDPEIYPRPWSFEPERFLDTQPGTYTWIPFGGGRRRCLGASFALEEMKIVLRATLSRWRLEPAGDRPEASRRRSITFSPSRSATVQLRAREPRPAPAREAFAAA